MAPPPSGVPRPSTKVIATNRRARRDFDISEVVEAGVVLRGAEVKALREAKVTLADAYARVIDGEAWLIGLHITEYSHAARQSGHEPDRDRKLLLHRGEIDRLSSKVDADRLTLVPLSLYFSDGRVKAEVGLGRGRRTVDKRQVIARREADREARRAMVRGAKRD